MSGLPFVTICFSPWVTRREFVTFPPTIGTYHSTCKPFFSGFKVKIAAKPSVVDLDFTEPFLELSCAPEYSLYSFLLQL